MNWRRMKNKWKLKKGDIFIRDGIRIKILQVTREIVFSEWWHGDRYGKDWNTLDYYNGLNFKD